MQDHYRVLGVIPTAEDVVIRAAYRALAAAYHPDRCDAPNAAERMKAINAAYEVLSDADRRRRYDEARVTNAEDRASQSFDDDAPDEPEHLQERWKVAVGFFPDLESQFKSLAAISWRLAFAFKLKLLEEKSFSSAQSVAEKMKRSHLAGHFGDNVDVRSLAEDLLRSRQFAAARRLREFVSVMGDNLPIGSLEAAIEREFPDAAASVRQARLLNQFRRGRSLDRAEIARELVESHGGEVRFSPKLFRTAVAGRLNGKPFAFENIDAFIAFVEETWPR